MSSIIKQSGRFLAQTRNVFRLYGIYPTVVTPFSGNDVHVDFGLFDHMLIHLNRYPVAGFALFGSSGEFASVIHDKKINLVAHARKYLGEHRIILAGAGLESTDDTVELVNKMAEAGADACFVHNPTYFRDRMDFKAYHDHFQKIADQSPVPIILYNIPSHMDMDISVDVVCDLAKHPNIIGLFDTSGNISRIATICKRTAPPAGMERSTKPFDVMCGSAGFLLPGLMVGCKGAICSLANVLPFELANLQELVEERKIEKAQKLQWRLMDPNEAITTKYGVAGLKAILKSHLEIDTGTVKAPLRNLSDEELKECLKMFHDNGFLISKKKTQEKTQEQKP